MSTNTLSARLLSLTIGFVMLAEILIFVPSIARFREDYLLLHLEKAQIASLSLLADDMIDGQLEAELLRNAGVYTVVLRRDEMSQLVLSSEMPSMVQETFDLRSAGPMVLIWDALKCLFKPDDSIVRVIGDPVKDAGLSIEVTLDSAPLRTAMMNYGITIFALSLVISAIVAGLLFVAVRRMLVKPIQRVVNNMSEYANAPEDTRKIMEPSAGILELNRAEVALGDLQSKLTASLQQKEHLAALGQAVARISHDLRNILTTAQLFADRMEMSKDPMVVKAAPKLMHTIERAAKLCESTLAYGRAEERQPDRKEILFQPFIDALLSEDAVLLQTRQVEFDVDVAETMTVFGDGEQIQRVLTNLLRNAVQAIEASDDKGRIAIQGHETEGASIIIIEDTGPGLPAKAQAHLFEAFQSSVRVGGTGLGLAISRDLLAAHGGEIELLHTSAKGTAFKISIPKKV
ncbi:MAG: sensor histidine kinase [Halocynthiibacter sp.]